ncbi:type IV secretory system conjugative DNA transfer family protein [Legionella sp.]|uniref:type IV secretory system conjugative DNA transfer family protein n=1 Tax=Legionella sp. TaxID=459 RepID=UPI003CB89310
MNNRIKQIITILKPVLYLLFFFELVSLLNHQWQRQSTFFVYPTEFIWDLLEGKFLTTSISLGIAGMVSVLAYLWIRGGLKRVISRWGFCFLFSVVFSGVMTTLIFNEWMHIRITNVRQLMDVVFSLTPHTKAYTRFLFSALLGCLLPILVLVTRLQQRFGTEHKALGNAHFASGWEIHQAGFFKQEQESIIIGKHYGIPLYSNGFEHVLVFAPPGSGKTRSIAIPNLFHYPHSVVCNDVKFSLFETTSGYRKEVLGHECYCFAPTRTDGITHCYNPLMVISQNKLERMTHIQQIAHSFIPDNPKESPIWTAGSRKLFKTLVLFLLDSEEYSTTFGEMNRLVKQENFDHWLQELLDSTDHFDPEFYRNGYSYLNNAEKTRQGILETFSGYFELFDDPFIDVATRHSDFSFADLRRKKMTIYMGFSDDEMKRLAPLLTLMWQQLISCMLKELPCPIQEPYPVLCLIDEFSSLGRIEQLRSSLKLLREYRVRCILMIQYIAQTYEKYSHDEAKAFINIKTKIAYTTEDLGDAELISKMLGTRTQRIASYSVNQQQQGISDGKSIAYQAIPLMRPDELMKMSPQVSLIIRSNTSPIKAKQFIWYLEESMKNNERGKIWVLKQIAKQMPFVRKRSEEECALEYLD